MEREEVVWKIICARMCLQMTVIIVIEMFIMMMIKMHWCGALCKFSF